MKILTCTPYYYYSSQKAIDPISIYFTKIPEKMGHKVHFFDFMGQARENKDRMNDFFLSIIKGGGYDLVIIATYDDEFYPETLIEAKKYTILLAWNSDDDWRWEGYSSKWCKYYTYMVTTYHHIYKANHKDYPNLLLSQWACSGIYDGLKVKKDINISFVGLAHGDRLRKISFINKRIPIKVYGMNTVSAMNIKQRIKTSIASMLRIPFQKDRVLNYDEVNNIWNCSKVSFTPLQNSKLNTLQIKSRIFEMGLSGTVMLCDHNPAIYEYYEPGKEYVEYNDMAECVEKAKYLLSHEPERQRIANAYYKRTKAEHMWEGRIKKIFSEMGL